MAATDLPETRKRKRFSKNKKKAWKKIDIEDVDEYLEDQRLQERTGGLVAEKTDDQLFFVDKAVPDTTGEPLNKRKKWQNKTLKSHALLEPDANIKPARVKHNLPVYSIKKHTPAVQEKLRSGVIKATERRAETQRQAALQVRKHQRNNQRKLPVIGFDLWNEEVHTEKDADPYFLEKTKKTLVKRPKVSTFYKEKNLPAVEFPHPGSSYNPTYDDHQDLLSEALQVEERKEKEALRIKSALDDKFPKGHEAPTEKTWLKEMSAGMDSDGSDSDSEEDPEPQKDNQDEDGEDRLSVNPPIRREDKKTERQRKKEKQRLAQAKLLSREKAKRQRHNEVFRLKSIKGDVAKRLKTLEEQAKIRAAKIEEKQSAPRKLGKFKFEEGELELKLSDEIQGSLRQLKPEGHLLEDRFKSLQKRNIIETRVRAKRVRKYKQKTYTKKSHKDVQPPPRSRSRKRCMCL